MRLLQGLVSSYDSDNRRFIVPRFTYKYNIYIEYTTLLEVITMLDLKGRHKRRSYPRVWSNYTK